MRLFVCARQEKVLARSPALNQAAAMPKLIASPTLVKAVGNKPKIIEEFIGRVNSGDEQVSIAHMPTLRSQRGIAHGGDTDLERRLFRIFAVFARIERSFEIVH